MKEKNTEVEEPGTSPADPTRPFWQMVSLFVALIGFLVTGAVLLMRGEILLMAVVKSLGVFVGLSMFLKLLGALWVAILGFELKEPEPSEDGANTASPEPAQN